MGSTKRMKGILLALTGAVMWGIMGIFVRGLSGEGYSSVDISFLRCFLAGVTFLIFKVITEPKILKIDIKGLFICVIYGIIAYAISFVSYSISVERIPVAVATVLMFMSPIWVALLGVLVFREKLKKQTVVIIIICIIGASLVANLIGASSGGMDAIGILAGIINGMGVALQLTIPKYFANKYKRDTMLVYGFLGAAIALAFLTDFGTIVESFDTDNISGLLINIIGIGIFCTMVANVSFVKATLYIDATTCSILSALEVVVGALVGYFLFTENLTALQILGAIIVVFGSLGPTILESIKSKNRVESN